MTGWKTDISAPYRNKCVICVAPHTSNWDFIIGLAAYKSLGRNANFLMKEFWFFFPLNFILKGLGGIPVPRKKKGAKLTEVVINKFRTSEYCNLAVTPEGTRSKQTEWKTGFLYIATEADVPIQLGVIDFKNKEVIIRDEYFPTGNIESDMKAIKAFYADKSSAARYPEKFSI
ncbi:MAG: 1-acyl-sn-glycerol-3-phosphate acyltransferase [Muribaculaceae bacterium]|nr:1-acyl-sn-glycerol-3-phosphate acyltransferase [Muribaculaceae bacterium]